MEAFKHPSEETTTTKAGISLHDAAVTMGHAGGPHGGPARAKALSAQERSSIAKKGGEAKGRAYGQTGKKGQSTSNVQAGLVHKAAGYNEPLHPQGPPNGQYGGRQPIVGPPRGQNPPLVDQETPRAAEAYGQAPQGVQDILRHLGTPRPRNSPRLPQEPVGDIRQAYGQAARSMGRGSGQKIG